MKRYSPIPLRAAVLLLAASVSMATTASAQPTTPFGHFDGQVEGGNGATGVVPLVGWALDDDGVAAVDVFVDGISAGRATYGGFRPIVAARFPGFPDSDAAGFGFRLDTTRYLNGLHTVDALVISDSGERRFLNPLVFEFYNAGHLLKPFGRIEHPLENAELWGTCDTSLLQRRLTVVDGWALDVGAEEDDFGVGYVELMIDGSLLANSRLHCAYLPAFGGPTQCYGVRRLDIERVFPLVKDSPHAGFRFVMDVGDLIAFGYSEGAHLLTIRSGDIAGQVTEIHRVPVTFRCDDVLGNEASFGEIDLPVDSLLFGGEPVEITGFAVDFEGVERVEIHVDGNPLGNAVLGLPRPLVAASFPGYPGVATAGWSFVLDVDALADGFHQIQAIVVDEQGGTTLIGERTFKVDNP
jgi:hypothetical protein